MNGLVKEKMWVASAAPFGLLCFWLGDGEKGEVLSGGRRKKSGKSIRNCNKCIYCPEKMHR
jgi:hypothetical protein